MSAKKTADRPKNKIEEILENQNNPERPMMELIEFYVELLPTLKGIIEQQKEKVQLEIRKLNLECEWLELQLSKHKPTAQA